MSLVGLSVMPISVPLTVNEDLTPNTEMWSDISKLNKTIQTITIPTPFDAHVHLRQVGGLAELVTPHVSMGGIKIAYVMPNTIPPITSVDMALEYQKQLQNLAPQTHFLMSLYLSLELTPDEIRKAKRNGIRGVKSYPRGVTTNSSQGVESYDVYYPVFKAMEEEGLILNLHGEVPSNPHDGTCVLNAEVRFLPLLLKLHHDFPSLRIVLEHATTKAAVEAVRSCNSNVACTITAHHLSLTVDDWAGNGLHFCKPVAKFPSDREALREVIRQGHPRFFLGSDSAPHPSTSKLPSATYSASQLSASPDSCHAVSCCAAGVYTSARLLPTLAAVFESALPPNADGEAFSPIPLENLSNFASGNGRQFYGLDDENFKGSANDVVLHRSAGVVEAAYRVGESENMVIPFWAGKKLGWEVQRS